MTASLADKKSELDRLRPLPAAALAALDSWFAVEVTHGSTALEGNTLTRQETAVVLEKGITVRGKPLKDHLEVLDHQDAWIWVREIAAGNEPMTEMVIRHIHGLVVGRTDKEEAGRYATTARLIAGADVRFPGPAEIPPLMNDFAVWLQRATDLPADAFEAHARLVDIHPFADGNGRTARLLMNLILIRDGWPPAVIAPAHRPEYLGALEARQQHGNNGPWASFMAARLEESLDRYLDVARQSL